MMRREVVARVVLTAVQPGTNIAELNVREAATRLKIGKTALYDALANAKSP